MLRQSTVTSWPAVWSAAARSVAQAAMPPMKPGGKSWVTSRYDISRAPARQIARRPPRGTACRGGRASGTSPARAASTGDREAAPRLRCRRGTRIRPRSSSARRVRRAARRRRRTGGGAPCRLRPRRARARLRAARRRTERRRRATAPGIAAPIASTRFRSSGPPSTTTGAPHARPSSAKRLAGHRFVACCEPGQRRSASRGPSIAIQGFGATGTPAASA